MKKLTAFIIAGLMLLSTFTACDMFAPQDGGDSEIVSTPEATPTPPVDTRSEEQIKIDEYEELLKAGTATETEFLALASLYLETGQIKNQRDTLEKCYRLNGSAEAFAILQDIVVNVEEEDALFIDTAQNVKNNLSIEDYNFDAVALVIGGEWFKNLMPKLFEGKRSYYLQDENNSELFIEAGYNRKGGEFINVLLTEANGDAVSLMQDTNGFSITKVGKTAPAANLSTKSVESIVNLSHNELRMDTLNTLDEPDTSDDDSAADVNPDDADPDDIEPQDKNIESNGDGVTYNGEFSVWRFVAESGDVYLESGTLQNGVLQGEYTIGFGNGKSEDGDIDLSSMFASRDLIELTTYTGSFNEDGTPAVKQPTAKEHTVLSGNSGSNYVIYAYDASGTNYLFVNSKEQAEEENIFDYNFLGIMPKPEIDKYEPVEQEEISVEKGEVTVDLSNVQIRIVDSAIEWFDGSEWHAMGSVDELAALDPYYEYKRAQQPPGGGVAAQQGDDDGEDELNAEEDESLLKRMGSGKITKQVTAKPKPKPTPAPSGGGGSAPAPTPAPVDNGPSLGGEADIEWSQDIL